MWQRAVLALLFSAVLAQPGQAADYYFSPSGHDDAGAGTPSAPWATLAKASALDLEPGDRVLLEGGATFRGSLYLAAEDAGTPARPVVVDSYGGGRARIESGTKDGVVVYNAGGVEIRDLVLVGTSLGAGEASGILFFSDLPGDVRLGHVRVSGVEVSGYGGSGLVVGAWNGRSGWHDVRVTGSAFHHNRDGVSTYAEQIGGITGLYLADNVAHDNPGAAGLGRPSGSGFVISGADGAVVEYNLAYGNGAHNTNRAGPVGIWAYDASDVLIQYNESYGNQTSGGDGGGFDLDGGVTHSVLQYNYSHDNEGAGYGLFQYVGASAYHSNVVRFNISERDGGAVHLWGGSGGMERVLVYGNTFYGEGHPLVRVWGQTGGAHFYNNLFISEGAPVVRASSSLAKLVFQGNGYWSSGGSFSVRWGAVTYDSLSAWREEAGQEVRDGAPVGFFGDPGLVAAGAGRTIGDPRRLRELASYRLTQGARARGAGLDLELLVGAGATCTGFYGGTLEDGLCSVGAAQGEPRLSQLIALERGWNLVSLSVRPVDARLEAVLAPILPAVVAARDAGGRLFYPEYGIDGIGRWDAAEALALLVREPVTLMVEGEAVLATGPLTVPLSAGWNVVPYPYQAALEPGEALAAIGPALAAAKDAAGRVYLPGSGLNALGDMQPGEGYLVFVTADTELTYAARPAGGSLGAAAK